MNKSNKDVSIFKEKPIYWYNKQRQARVVYLTIRQQGRVV